MAATGDLELLLNRARRRYLANLVFDQVGVALSLAMGGAILLLVLGTQILNWYWPVLLLVAGLGIGVYRLRRRIPSLYRLAQQIDHRLSLHDALSTAFHFMKSRGNSDVIECQRRAAEQMARSASLEAAVPVKTPRSAWVCAGLLLIAGAMFGLRYGLTRTLDLQRPIAEFRFNPFGGDQPAKQAYNKKSLVQEKLEEQMKQLGIPLEQLPTPASEGEQVTDKTASALASPDGKNPVSSDEDGQTISEKSAPLDGADKSEGSEKSEGTGTEKGNETGGQEGSSGSPEQSAQQGKPQTPPAAGKNGNNNNDSSLSSKLKDALSNLMAKMKSPPKPSDQQQTASAQGSQAGQKGQQPQNQKGSQGKPQGEGQSDQDQKGDQEGDSGDKGQSGQSKSGDKAEHAANQDAKSGIGKQDGNKELRDAEQLAAMGRISELLGRRSQQVTGEMTVEVPSGKQQLKTAYSQKKALHADAGGEMNRDEIPLIYQSYVQRYFEEVRKTPAKTKN